MELSLIHIFGVGEEHLAVLDGRNSCIKSNTYEVYNGATGIVDPKDNEAAIAAIKMCIRDSPSP